MRRRIQEVIEGGNLSEEISKKIEEYKKFEESFFAGEGDAILGVGRMDEMEEEIVALSKKEAINVGGDAR